MQLRRRDVEQWMSHRRLPEDLRRFDRKKLLPVFNLLLDNCVSAISHPLLLYIENKINCPHCV